MYSLLRYYKGLGTSSSAEAKEYFKALARHKIDFEWNEETDNGALELAFQKDKVEARKEWLAAQDPDLCMDYNIDAMGCVQ